MKNLYDGQEADAYIKKYPDQPEEVALRVYTSQLIGREEDLVLHGGGNTSVKGEVANILGDTVETLFIKGSGWDLVSIEPPGFPGLDLGYLLRLRGLESMSDEEMVNQFRTHMLDSTAPNPSIETLVHAFLPHKYIDHTHADAIVALTNQKEADRHIRAALGDKVGILPFIMPGFPLAKEVAALYESDPDMECIILKNHGIFTFGPDAETSYERMIHYVTLAEEYLAQGRAKTKSPAMVEAVAPAADVVLPLLRGALSYKDAQGGPVNFYLHVSRGQDLLDALNREDAEQLFVSGVLTPDHVIRTKNTPVFLNFAACGSEEDIKKEIFARVEAFREEYQQYFREQTAAKGVEKTMLDTSPRVLLAPGLGVITAGKSVKEARIAADIARHTILTKIAADAIGTYQQLADGSIFDMEYWSLEQVKLGKQQPLPLQGKVALVTGGGGAIAVGIGRQLLKAGAVVVLSDIDSERLALVERKLAGEFSGALVSSVLMDVTDENSITHALNEVIFAYGGLDILVPNAGVAHVDKLADLDENIFRKVAEVNMFGVFRVIKAVIPSFRRQGTGGNVVINSSKNVFDPGAGFGAYSASKAGAHQLGKIAALELAELGVRVNMINADAIFDAGEVSSGLWDVVGPDRMRARNLDPQGLKEYYRQRNLLKTEVTADHVGKAVVFFAAGTTPTTGATLTVDGGIPAAFPR